MAQKWYAVHCKPRKEIAVLRQVVNKGIETFYPQIKVQPVNPRSRKRKPYFPGYLFVYVDLEQVGVSTFKWLPHAHGLVIFGDEPAVVPENLIYAIRKKVEQINLAGGEVFHGLNKGDTVVIADGPFQGYEAIFDEKLPGSERVRVLLELLGSQRKVPLVLPSGQISKKRA